MGQLLLLLQCTTRCPLCGAGSCPCTTPVLSYRICVRPTVSKDMLFNYSVSKLRAVRGVALVGGVLQVLLTMVLAGGVASAIGASVHEGVFIGALVRLQLHWRQQHCSFAFTSHAGLGCCCTSLSFRC